MDFLAQLLVSKPAGFWEGIVFGLEAAIKDYAFTIIVITLIIKAIMLPLDLLNKYISKNNARKMAVLNPQLAKLKKTYANNQQVLNQKTMELYKKENYSVVGTCLGTLVNIILTSVVFISLLGSLNSIANYKQVDEFVTLRTTYNTTYESAYDAKLLELGEINDDNEALATQWAITSSNAAVVEKYGEIKTSFLWVKSLWKSDTSTSAISSYDDFTKFAGDLVKEDNTDYVSEAEYNTIMNPVKAEYGGNNGWYLLIILAALTSYLSFQLTTWMNKNKAKKQGVEYKDPVGNNKIMVYLLTILMAVFTFIYNAAFALYVVAGGLFSLITGPFVTMLADKIDEHKEKKEKSKITVSYSRKK